MDLSKICVPDIILCSSLINCSYTSGCYFVEEYLELKTNFSVSCFFIITCLTINTHLIFWPVMNFLFLTVV